MGISGWRRSNWGAAVSECEGAGERLTGFVGNADDSDGAVGVGQDGDVVGDALGIADGELYAPVELPKEHPAGAIQEIVGEFGGAVDRISEIGKLRRHSGVSSTDQRGRLINAGGSDYTV